MFSVSLNKFVRLIFYRIPTAIVSVSYNYVKNHNFRKKYFIDILSNILNIERIPWNIISTLKFLL